jgi:hypothetical protein
MKTILLIVSFVMSTSVFASEGAVKIKGPAANQMIFQVLESLKREKNPSVHEQEEGDARILQLSSEAGTLTCKDSEGVKNGQPAESVVSCDVNVD